MHFLCGKGLKSNEKAVWFPILCVPLLHLSVSCCNWQSLQLWGDLNIISTWVVFLVHRGAMKSATGKEASWTVSSRFLHALWLKCLVSSVITSIKFWWATKSRAKYLYSFGGFQNTSYQQFRMRYPISDPGFFAFYLEAYYSRRSPLLWRATPIKYWWCWVFFF